MNFTTSEYVMRNVSYYSARNGDLSFSGNSVSMYGMPEPYTYPNSPTPWVINPTPIPWTPTPTPYDPQDLIDAIKGQQAGEEEQETLEDTIQAVQAQALYDVQNGHITEEQFFEVMKMTFAMLKLLPKKEKPDAEAEAEDR